MFRTKNYDPDIDYHNNVIMKKIIDNPLEYYYNMRDNLIKNGPTASCLEFKGVVSLLTKKIFQDKNFDNIINNDISLLNLRLTIVNSLISIQLEDRYIYPYKATILVIEEMLKFIDIVLRKNDTTLSPYYHNFRYRMYLTWMLDECFPDFIVFPTIKILDSIFFIKTRCIPCAFLGVSVDSVLANAFINSPLEFWGHDIQHNRRIFVDNQRYFDIVFKHQHYYIKRTPFNVLTIDDFYKEQYDFSKFIMNIIDIKNSDSKKVKAYKKIQQMIVFEVIHEKDWPLTKFSLCRNIPIGYESYPPEQIVFNEKTKTLRATSERSIKQSFRDFDYTTLAGLYRKLRHGFYNFSNNPDQNIVPSKYRTAIDIATAAYMLLNKLDCSTKITELDLIKLTQDLGATEEFIVKPEISNLDKKINTDFKSKLHPYWHVELNAPLTIRENFKKNFIVNK